MFRTYSINRIVKEAENITSFYLTPKDDLPLPLFQGGQYVNVKLTGQNDIRSYTLSSAPNQNHLRITVKQELRGKVSTLLHQLKRNDELQVSEPLGNFIAPKNETPLVLLSAGVGITPFISIIESTIAEKSNRKIHLVHISRSKSTQAFPQQTQQFKKLSHLNVTQFHSQPLSSEIKGKDYDYLGYTSKEFLQSIASKDAHFMICGPTEMMNDTLAYLKQLEIKDDQISTESFGGVPLKSNQPASASSTGIEVKFTESDIVAEWNGEETLLELAERNGLNPVSSCRMGTCLSCETGIRKGTITYEPEPFFEPEGEKVLICCSTPATNVELSL